TLLSGGTVKLSDIFGKAELDEGERPKISFADNGYDDYSASVEADLGEQYYIIESAKAVYDWSVLSDILGDSVSISDAKVKLYEKHKKDLAYLKKVVRKICPEKCTTRYLSIQMKSYAIIALTSVWRRKMEERWHWRENVALEKNLKAFSEKR
ncbi:CRISPR-associated endonuclease, Csn1 family, partial [human gut metagenome]